MKCKQRMQKASGECEKVVSGVFFSMTLRTIFLSPHAICRIILGLVERVLQYVIIELCF